MSAEQNLKRVGNPSYHDMWVYILERLEVGMVKLQAYLNREETLPICPLRG